MKQKKLTLNCSYKKVKKKDWKAACTGISYFLKFLEMLLFVQASFIQISSSVCMLVIWPQMNIAWAQVLFLTMSAWLHWAGVCFLFAVSGKCVTSTPQGWPFSTLTFDPRLFVRSQSPSGISLPNTLAARIQTLQDIGQTLLTELITFLLSSSSCLFLSSLFSLCLQLSCFPVCLLHYYVWLPVPFSHNKEYHMRKCKISI